MNGVRVALGGETVELLPARGLYRPAVDTLYVADLHVGKAAAFRAAGLPLPRGTTDATLARVGAMLAHTGAGRLVLLGDLLHARAGRHPETMGSLRRWRTAAPELIIELVRGNHDRGAGDPDPDLDICCHDEPRLDGGWMLRHQPVAEADQFFLAGHVHPALALHGAGRQTLLLPCFHATPLGVVLPACGAFTGGAAVRPLVGDRLFVIADDEVIER
jgi:DNA ligase-associated metallophosphoesterase